MKLQQRMFDERFMLSRSYFKFEDLRMWMEKELGIGIDSILADFYIHFGNDSLFNKTVNKYDNFDIDAID